MVSEENKKIIIRSASDAWALLERAKNNDIPSNLDLVFDGWPAFEMNVKGKDWHSTVPTRVMGPLLEIQKDIYRILVQIQYGSTSLHRLREDDRDQFELVIRVKEGSSDYKAPLDKALTDLARRALEKMNSKDIVIAIVSCALLYGSQEVGKSYIASRQAEKQAEITVDLSKQETERLKLMADVARQSPVAQQARTDYEASQNRLLKVAKPTDDITLSAGVQLKGYEAAEIAQPERASSEDVDLRGTFRILANDASKEEGFKIKVSRINDGLTFIARVPIELSVEQKQLIQKAEWSHGSVFVNLHITATVLRGKISDALVYSALPVDK